jgi:glyoxylase-like metal-dependent hydrolase (beta-lactamase superfamily II)
MLWDSGLSDDIAKHKDGITAREGKFHMQVKKPFLVQLANMGLYPKDFSFIAFSHYHSDHVGNANAFKGVTQLIQQEEYDAAYGDTPEKFGFNPKVYEELKNGPFVKLTGDHDVFGDGSVVIKRAIGHTPGHQALFVDLAKTGPLLISGDLYHFADNRVHQRVPVFNFSAEESKKSMVAIENFVAIKKATMWIEHDFEQNSTLRHAPEYYE